MNPPSDTEGAILDGLWYLAGRSREVRTARLLRRVIFGEPLVLGRARTGQVFALSDVCAHRGAPLSAGRCAVVNGRESVVCPYHGWSFAIDDGRCIEAPALAGGNRELSMIGVKRFSLHEADGLLWIYYGDGAPETAPPALGLWSGAIPGSATVVDAAGPFDEAVIGLVDPAHTPVVHRQWWWREGAPRREKVKEYVPSELGFKIPAHPPSSNSRIYRALGGAPTTEIEFRLPGLRLERIVSGSGTVLGLTAMTPIERGHTRISHIIYWNSPLLTIAKPVIDLMAASFLAQDAEILSLQNTNLSRNRHRSLFLGDPDEPAKWYLRLKKAWAARRETGGFKNLTPASTLRWQT